MCRTFNSTYQYCSFEGAMTILLQLVARRTWASGRIRTGFPMDAGFRDMGDTEEAYLEIQPV